MEDILFVASLTIVIHYIVKVISVTFGNSMATPIPVLHCWDIGFTNTYISTPAIMYQVYFWAIYCGVLPI